MSKAPDSKYTKGQEDFLRKVGEQEARKVAAKRRTKQTAWFGLGMFGLVGWSVVVPTLAGVALGIWLDRRHPGTRSWTLVLLVAGLTVGCLNAWHWIAKEEREMRREEKSEKGDENDE